MAQRQSHYLDRSGTWIWRDGEADPQSLVSVPNIPGLHPKSLCSAYEVKAYVRVLLITSRRIGTLSPATALMLLKKSRLMPATDFPFTFPHLKLLHHITTLTHTLILDIISYFTDTHNSIIWPSEVVIASICSKAGPKRRRVGIGTHICGLSYCLRKQNGICECHVLNLISFSGEIANAL